MRLVALMVASLLVGCAASSADDSSASSSAVSGECAPMMYYDDDIIVYTDFTYAPKQLHVTEQRITPANPNATSDWEGSRFHESHVEYVLTPRVGDDAIARARAAVGGAIRPAVISINPSGASVQTMVTAGTTTYSVVDGSLVVELTDKFEGPAAPGSGPVIGASLHKSLLLNARAYGKAGACDLALMTSTPVTFEVNEAKVLVPGFEMSTIDELLAFSNTYRAGHLKSTLERVASSKVDGAAEAFSAYIEREVRPLTSALATLPHDELVAKLEAAWQALRSFAHVVLAETHAAVDEDTFVSKRDDGVWVLGAMNGDAVQLLTIGETVKTNLEGAIRDTSGGWTTRPLVP